MRNRKKRIILWMVALAAAALLNGCGQADVPVPEEIEAHSSILEKWRKDYRDYQDEWKRQEEARQTETENIKYDADFFYDNTKSMLGFINSEGAASGTYVRLIREAGNILKSADYINPSGISAYRLKQSNTYLEWTKCSLSSEIMAGFTRVDDNMYTASDERGSLCRREDGSPIGPLSMLFSEEGFMDTSAVTIVVTDMLEQGFEYDSMLERMNVCLENVSDFGVAILGAYSDYDGDVTFTSYANQGLAEVTVRDFSGERAFFVIILGPADGVSQYYQDISNELGMLCSDWGGIYCENSSASKNVQEQQELKPVPIPLGSFQLQEALYDAADVSKQRELKDIGQLIGSLNLSGKLFSAEDKTYENVFSIEKRNLISLSDDQFTMVCSLMEDSLQADKQAVVYHSYQGTSASESGGVMLSDRIQKADIRDGMTCYEIKEDEIVFRYYDTGEGIWKEREDMLKGGSLQVWLGQMEGMQKELDKTLLAENECAAYLRVEWKAESDAAERGWYYLSVPVAAAVYQEAVRTEAGDMAVSDGSIEERADILCEMGTTAGAVADAVEQLSFQEWRPESRSQYYSWASTDEDIKAAVSDTLAKAVDLQYIVKGIQRNCGKADADVLQEEEFSDSAVQYVDFLIQMK